MCSKQILILNLLHEESFSTSFDNRIAEVFENIETPYKTIYLNNLKSFNDFDTYTHLLISGSTKSTTGENDWYPDIDTIISQFISDEKAILGICFGHQFLVRHLMGKDHVRKSLTPEIGFTEIYFTNNPIFQNITKLKSAVFHFDEVFDLDKQFEIIASSQRCAVHGFQVKGKPIWGVQFHPDFIYDDIFTFAIETKKKVKNFSEIHCQTPTSLDEFKTNDLIIKNWIEIT